MADDTKPTIMAEKDGPLYIQNAKGLILLDSDGSPFEITLCLMFAVCKR